MTSQHHLPQHETTHLLYPHLRAGDNSIASADEMPYAFLLPEEEKEETKDHHGHASVSHTVTNMAKTCMGTGCLALPFAARQGGLVLHTFGLLAIAIWNVVMVQRLCRCYDLLPVSVQTFISREEEEEDDEYQIGDGWERGNGYGNPSSQQQQKQQQQQPETLPLKRFGTSMTQTESIGSSYQSLKSNISDRPPPLPPPPPGTTTLSKLAWYALGPIGSNVLDFIMVLYLIGVIVTYLNAMKSFLRDTVFTTGIGFLDSLLLVVIMGPLSVVPHTGHLAGASATGLLVLFLTFTVIAGYGYFVQHDNHDDQSWEHMTSDTPHTRSQPQPPPPQQQQHEPFWLPTNGVGGISQWFGCVIFGFGIIPLTFNFRDSMEEPHKMVGAAWWSMMAVAVSYIILGIGLLYPFPTIQGDVLHELPRNGWLPTATRLAMLLVVLVTAPLLIVPCGELLEGKIRSHDAGSDNGSWKLKATVRWTICLVCAAVSTFVPGFVDVLSCVGACCVAVVGFCVPPFLHLILSMNFEKHNNVKDLTLLWVPDVVLFLWGLFATVVSTIYTFKEVLSPRG